MTGITPRLIRACLFTAIIPILLIFAVYSPSLSQTSRVWVATEVSGDAHYRDGGGVWRGLAQGAVVNGGDRLRTGSKGKITPIRGADMITVTPGSNLEIRHTDSGIATRILQTLGTLLFRVERGPDTDFSVQTPYLSATVKGTRFSVTVNSEGGAVHVTQGLVSVTALAARQTVLVRPGQTAVVSSSGRGGVRIRGGRGRGQDEKK